MTERRRIDLLLVERGLFESRAKAQAAIAAGLVTANGVTVTKAANEITIDAVLTATPAHPYVSRGGVKLAGALDYGTIDVAGKICLDIGASTGGFSEVLALRGARRITAVDVGHGQLHPKLRGHSEIVSMEGTDIRALTATQLGEPPGDYRHRRQLHFAQTGVACGIFAGCGALHAGDADQAAI